MRQWRESDRVPFAELNADPEVMLHFPDRLTREKSDALADRIEAVVDENGWGLWAVEIIDGPEFIGFVGLMEIPFTAHFTPATEVGWRLGKEHWGKGYATEAAQAALNYGFENIHLSEIVSMTIPLNKPSWSVMERIGMTRDPNDDFDHPNLPPGHPMQRHILYRVRAN